VDRLESRGLVRRRPSAADRRVKVLDLTPKGSRLRELLLDRMTAPPATLQKLSAAEQRALVPILARLLENESHLDAICRPDGQPSRNYYLRGAKHHRRVTTIITRRYERGPANHRCASRYAFAYPQFSGEIRLVSRTIARVSRYLDCRPLAPRRLSMN